MAFDLWILSLIGCAIGMFMISMVQDLIVALRRHRERAAALAAVRERAMEHAIEHAIELGHEAAA